LLRTSRIWSWQICVLRCFCSWPNLDLNRYLSWCRIQCNLQRHRPWQHFSCSYQPFSFVPFHEDQHIALRSNHLGRMIFLPQLYQFSTEIIKNKTTKERKKKIIEVTNLHYCIFTISNDSTHCSKSKKSSKVFKLIITYVLFVSGTVSVLVLLRSK
jgi:hypothetical protein